MTNEDTFFSICGAPKAGTTSLHQYLGEHPRICMSDPKETDFFQHHYDRGWKWFESCFAPVGEEDVFGEASPGNMIHPEAARRIAEHRPDAKLIFILRDPVERAYSQHLYSVMRGTDASSISFSELIQDQNSEWGRRVLELGLYYDQLRRFERHFSRDQLWIGLFQDFRKNNKAFVRDIFDFLGVDPSARVEPEEKHNTTRYPRSKVMLRLARKLWEPVKSSLPERMVERLYGVRSSVRDLLFQPGMQEKPPMKPEDRAYLREYYAEPNSRLEEWLGCDLSHWT